MLHLKVNFWNKTLVQPHMVPTKKSEGSRPQENKPWWNKRLLKVVPLSSSKCMQTSWTNWYKAERRDKTFSQRVYHPGHPQATLCQLLARIQEKDYAEVSSPKTGYGQQGRNEALGKIWHLHVKNLVDLPQKMWFIHSSLFLPQNSKP